MTRHLQINENLYLVQSEVSLSTPPEDTGVTACTNHIFIYDRSGSMYGLLTKLTKDFVERAKQIPFGDTISIGWFSTEGQFNFILKGFKINSDADYSLIESAVYKNNSTIGLTCFSEILHETADNVIRDLAVFSDRYALAFFTDGYPVVSNYSKEISSIYAAIEKLEKVLTSSVLIGYGNYYNKELMSAMAQKLGGSLAHSTDMPSFNAVMTDFMDAVKGADNRIQITLNNAHKTDLYFGVSDSTVNIYEPKDNVISFTPTKKGKNYLYHFSAFEPKDSECIKLVDSAVNHNTKIGAFLKGIYAGAYILVQRAQVNQALELLGVLGDVSIINSVANAFTNDEYGKAEARIVDCIKSPNKRFLSGRDTQYLPAKDAFCVLDLIEILCADPDAYFYPRHPAFTYNRIGATSVPKDGYPTFEAYRDNACAFNSISWNDTRLNLSVLLKLDGEIMLKKGFKKLGFTDKMYKTFVWRNYALIKDGFLNVQKLPVAVSADTHAKLAKEGLIETEADGVCVLDLTKLPVMNRSIAEGNTSAKALFNKAWKSLQQKAALKVYKYFRSALSPEKLYSSTQDLSAEQVQYLADLGVTDKGFSPPCDKIAPTDFYFAKEFKITIKKYSSLPKVDAVVSKLNSGKTLTPSEELLAPVVKECTAYFNGKDTANQLQYLDERIAQVYKENLALTNEIQRIKFSIILGNQWFDEFDSRENCTMDIDGVQFEISLTNTKKVEL